ncbi:hypothetical protein [Paraburkholderia sp. BCC1885]|uniref:hypothetical protein n=1 Tax=Paraburkholderia sp. BCC1885 TaxID=2562669 RepID=UPI001182ACD5|nr:hypothetical protein [Paraburkholderia sp. BCC1885]
MAKHNSSDDSKVDIEVLKKAIRILESPKAKRERERAALFSGLYDVIRDKVFADVSKSSIIKALANQGSHAEPASLDNLIREIITDVVRDATCELDDQIYHLQGTIREDFNEQTAALAYIMREISDCKALLMENRTNQSSGRRRCKVNMRKRRFVSTVRGGERG